MQQLSPWEELDERLLAGVPRVLPDVEDASEGETLASLTGAEYLHTDHALGLSVDAQEKLAELVDGRGAVSATGKRACDEVRAIALSSTRKTRP